MVEGVELNLSLFNTLQILLLDTIENEMMRPRGSTIDPSKQKLRVVTGTFSESAKVISVDASNNIIYDYQRAPYDVFPRAKFGDGIGRDPKFIIEGAIRSIMQRNFTDRIIVAITSI